MHFRLGTLFILLLVTSSCGWIHDRPKPQKSFAGQSMDMDCLKQLPNHLQKIFAGQYTDSAADQQEVTGTFQCINKTLDSFSKNTHGANPNYYGKTELLNFANQFLPADNKLTASFLDSVFQIKASFLGGDPQTLTRDEIAALITKISETSTMVLPFCSQIHLLLHPLHTSISARIVATARFNAFTDSLSTLFEQTPSPLRWKDIDVFIHELDHFIDPHSSNSLAFVHEQLPLIQYFKLLVVGGSIDQIEPNKWRPILSAFANFYQAYLLTTTSTDLLSQIQFNIQSNSSERKIAITHLNSLLKTMVTDPTLVTHDLMVSLSNAWALAQIGNAVLYPESQGDLAIQDFVTSGPLRRFAGSILDQIQSLSLAPRSTAPDPAKIQKISTDVQSLLESVILTATSNTGIAPTVSIANLKLLTRNLSPLFSDSNEEATLQSGINITALIRNVVLNKDTDVIPLSDFKDLIQRFTDLYLVWMSKSANDSSSIAGQLARSLEIILKDTPTTAYSQDQLLAIVDQAQDLVGHLNITVAIDWTQFRTLIRSSFAAKAILFADDEHTLLSSELQTGLNLLAPFQNNLDPAAQFQKLGDLLQSKPFPVVSLPNLIAAIQPLIDLLPKGTLPIPINASIVGAAKVALVGGTADLIAQNDFSALAYAASVFTKNSNAELKAFPKNYQPTLESHLVHLMGTAIQSIAEFQAGLLQTVSPGVGGVDLVAFENLVLALCPSINLTIPPDHLEHALIGLNYRLFQGQKGAKPTTLAGVITPKQLLLLMPLIQGTYTDLVSLEKGYDDRSVPVSGDMLRKKVNSKTIQHFLDIYKPQLNADRMTLQFPKKGEVIDRYYYIDLAGKVLTYYGLQFAMPGYQIEPDTALAPLRLTLADLTDLLFDINDLLRDLQITYTLLDPAANAKERMVTVNVFTSTGNGDTFMDVDETVEFVTMVIGGITLLDQVRKGMVEKCLPGQDYHTVTAIPGNCFVDTYFSPEFYEKFYGPVIPQFADAVAALSGDAKEAFIKNTLLIADPALTRDTPFHLNQIEELSSLPQYVETVFERLDLNQDGIIKFSEAMHAFPIFCGQIESLAQGKLKGSCIPGANPGQYEAIYGYLIMNGKAPAIPGPGASIRQIASVIFEMLKWFRVWKHLDKRPEVRDALPPQYARTDLMQILTALAQADRQAAP